MRAVGRSGKLGRARYKWIFCGVGAGGFGRVGGRWVAVEGQGVVVGGFVVRYS